MNRRRYWVSLVFVFAAVGWAKRSFAVVEATPEVQSAIVPGPPPVQSAIATAPGVQSAIVPAPSRDRVLGVGFHPGNFVGPLAFDVILRPLPHIAIDVQAAASSSDPDLGVHTLQVAPQLQWEFRRGWRSTPYVGLGYRYEEDRLDGVTATSKGGFLVGGWQFRWRSGFGVLVGGGVLYKTPLTLNTPVASTWSSGGWSGTYEVGARYFF